MTLEWKISKALIAYVKQLSELVRFVDPHFKKGCNFGQSSEKKGRILKQRKLKYELKFI